MYRKERSKIGHNLKIIFLITTFCLVSTFTKAQEVKCRDGWNPDIPLTTATEEQLSEIEMIYDRLSDEYLGRISPRNLQDKLNTAKQNYDKLNIRVTDGNIYGNITGNISGPSVMIFTFAQYIKFRPTASNIREIKQKASNMVWLISKKYCEGELRGVFYEFDDIFRAIMYLRDYLSDNIKKMLGYVLYKHYNASPLWPSEGEGSYSPGDGVDTDMMYLAMDSFIAYATWFSNDDERVRWMKGITRFMERFMSYSYASADGIKPDGSGFHHWVAYDNYMYAYNTVIKGLKALDNTSFQINKDSYLIFRDAIYAQRMMSNDKQIKSLSSSGRKPYDRYVKVGYGQVKDLAIIGGHILEETTEDPVLAGYYNRVKKATDPRLSYRTITPFEQGYIQFNHAHAGVYRGNNWLVYFKGFSNYMFGSEIYRTENRYGRYQSYGAMEIINSGDFSAEDNGFDLDTWNWNFNPGTTTIKLPWEKLRAEHKRIDEIQKKRFVGSLSLKNKGSDALTKTFGTYGLFAMDFQENQSGWNCRLGPDTHNNSFTFKKSNFAFSDMIVCLGSGISNNDGDNRTITTLYQRLANSRNVKVNGTAVSTGSRTFTGSNNWVLSNANTGFYVVNGGNIKVWSGTSPTPNQNQPSADNFLNNNTQPNTYGYIDHGASPSNAGYEYVCIPKTTVEKMTALRTNMQNSNNRPYIVYQKNANAHIVEHKKDKIWGYSFFTTNSNIKHTGSLIKGNDHSCLVMYQKIGTTNNILLSMTNPDLGFGNRQTTGASPTVNIRLNLHGKWSLLSTNPDVKLISSNNSETVLEFKTVDGLPVEVQLNSHQNNLSSDNFEINSYIKFYPNPVVDLFHIAGLKSPDITVQVFAYNGQLVYSKNHKPVNEIVSLSMRDLSAGLYIIRIFGEKAGDNITFKMTKM